MGELSTLDLEEIINAGDSQAWSLDDWNWDAINFTATPKHDIPPSSCRAGKRQRSGDGSPAFLNNSLQDTVRMVPVEQGFLGGCQAFAKTGLLGVQGSQLEVPVQPAAWPEAACSAAADSLLPLDSSAPQGTPSRRSASSISPQERSADSAESPPSEPLSEGQSRAPQAASDQLPPNVFTRSGAEMRFCQQCGRAHELSAFEGRKHSCRDQLAKHNARRRKRQGLASASASPGKATTKPAAAPEPVQDTGRAASLPAPVTAPCNAAASLAQWGLQTAVTEIPHAASHSQLPGIKPELFNCTPTELPSDLRQQLTGWLKTAPAGAEGYMRPGCVHLTLQAHMPRAAHAAVRAKGVAAAVDHLVQADPAGVWGTHAMLAQLGDQLALVKFGQLVAVWDLAKGSGAANALVTRLAPTLPAIHRISPVCLTSAAGGAVHMSGANLADAECTVLCRCDGGYVAVEVYHLPASSGCSDQGEKLVVQLPPNLTPGTAFLEDAFADAHVARTAAELAVYACNGGLPEIAALALAMASEVSRMEDCCLVRADGLTLLHRAVRAGSPATVQAVLEECPCMVLGAGPAGITPLHLAALVHDNGATATRLVRAALPEAATAWFELRTPDGLSPADFAMRAGQPGVNAAPEHQPLMQVSCATMVGAVVAGLYSM
ncbi:hypothetical protein WJX72_002446 [[Myrmecia] bisecta]|uniref:SBP-type domain-containing protein n=1 Tax=[Myrmecia] bisecta TaxID=41462 RepID=A0AAW1PWA3_9CHLO